MKKFAMVALGLFGIMLVMFGFSYEKPSACDDGVLLMVQARSKPGSGNWDAGFGDVRKPDMMGHIVLNGERERMNVRHDKMKITVPFFEGKRVDLTGLITIHIVDKDLEYNDEMASAQVDVRDLLGPEWLVVDNVELRMSCR